MSFRYPQPPYVHEKVSKAIRALNRKSPGTFSPTQEAYRSLYSLNADGDIPDELRSSFLEARDALQREEVSEVDIQKAREVLGQILGDVEAFIQGKSAGRR